MRYLLDTNTCIAIMRKDAAHLARMSALSPGDCAISTVTSYELYTGVEKCSSPVKEAVKVGTLLQTVHALPFDSPAAQEAGRVRADLEARGCPIGPYDILLAGHAIAANLIMVTANIAEFSRVNGLTIETWKK